MNNAGQYTDHHSRVIMPGDRVNMVLDNQAVPRNAPGVVVSLPKEGNDYYGFPLVDFGKHGRKHVPDNSLSYVRAHRLEQNAPRHEPGGSPAVTALLDLIESHQTEIAVSYALARLLRETGA